MEPEPRQQKDTVRHSLSPRPPSKITMGPGNRAQHWRPRRLGPIPTASSSCPGQACLSLHTGQHQKEGLFAIRSGAKPRGCFLALSLPIPYKPWTSVLDSRTALWNKQRGLQTRETESQRPSAHGVGASTEVKRGEQVLDEAKPAAPESGLAPSQVRK